MAKKHPALFSGFFFFFLHCLGIKLLPLLISFAQKPLQALWVLLSHTKLVNSDLLPNLWWEKNAKWLHLCLLTFPLKMNMGFTKDSSALYVYVTSEKDTKNKNKIGRHTHWNKVAGGSFVCFLGWTFGLIAAEKNVRRSQTRFLLVWQGGE